MDDDESERQKKLQAGKEKVSWAQVVTCKVKAERAKFVLLEFFMNFTALWSCYKTTLIDF